MNALRPVRRWNWGRSTWWQNNGSATYNALQVLFKYQVQKLQLQAAYTWGHSIGDIHLTNSSRRHRLRKVYLWGANPYIEPRQHGINRPQIFVANAVYYLPDLKGQNGSVQAVAGGWELAGITQYASGRHLVLPDRRSEATTCRLAAATVA